MAPATDSSATNTSGAAKAAAPESRRSAELSALFWNNTSLRSILIDMLPLDEKLRVRCASFWAKQLITNNTSLAQQTLQHIVLPYVAVHALDQQGRPLKRKDILEECMHLAMQQRQLQLARSGITRILQLPDAEVKATFRAWRRTWQPFTSYAFLPRQKQRKLHRSSFNAYLFQRTAGNTNLLRAMVRFDLDHFEC